MDENYNMSCEYCGKAFQGRYAKYNLKRHMIIHRGEKPFSCPYCPHSANQKVNLKGHINRFHPEKINLNGSTIKQSSP